MNIAMPLLNFLVSLAYRFLQIISVNRFQQIIDGADAEGFGGKFIMSGSEYDAEVDLIQHFQHFKSIHPGHFNIEKHKIRLFPFYCHDAFLGRMTNSNYFDRRAMES